LFSQDDTEMRRFFWQSFLTANIYLACKTPNIFQTFSLFQYTQDDLYNSCNFSNNLLSFSFPPIHKCQKVSYYYRTTEELKKFI